MCGYYHEKQTSDSIGYEHMQVIKFCEAARRGCLKRKVRRFVPKHQVVNKKTGAKETVEGKMGEFMVDQDHKLFRFHWNYKGRYWFSPCEKCGYINRWRSIFKYASVNQVTEENLLLEQKLMEW